MAHAELIQLPRGSSQPSPVAQVHSIDFVDKLRGLAVLSVFAFHSLGVAFGTDAPDWQGNFRDFASVTRTYYPFFPLAFGGYGVAIFFVVSGFCIHISYEKSSKSWRAYASRRCCRIYPPYAIALVLIAGTSIALGSMVGFRDVAFHMLLIHNLDKDLFFTINPSFWSIATEVQLYILYPLLYITARRTGWGIVCGFCLFIELAIRIVRGFHEEALPFWVLESPLAYCGSWSMGAWLAHRYLSNNVRKFHFSIYPVLLSLLLGCYFYRPAYFLAFTCAAALSVILLSNRIGQAITTTSLTSKSLIARFIGYVGLISYSVYLFHQPILRTIGQVLLSNFPSIHPVLVLIICMLACLPIVAISALSYRFIEQPSSRLHRWFVTPSAQPTPNAL